MLAGYQSPNPTQTMTAEAVFSRVLLGDALTAAEIGEVTAYLEPPGPLERANYYRWYYGSLALVQLQTPAWRRWNEVVRERLVRSQVSGGAADGSWVPSESVWGVERGGRVYTTAVAALTLEVYYRYLPMMHITPVRPGG